jgi:hypothetical protein
MKFSLIEELTINYPIITNPLFKNNLVKDTLYWFLINSNKAKNIIKDIKFDILDENYAKFNFIVNYKNKDQLLNFEIINNNIKYNMIEEISNKIININSPKDFFENLINLITQENINYNSTKTEILEKYNINKLKDDALNIVKEKFDHNTGQCHIMINIISREYEYYLLNKDSLDYTINITNLFNWNVKYKNFNFEIILTPDIHPLIAPIINFGKIYINSIFLLNIIKHPYIINWNPYHSVFILIKNIIQIIKNYETYIDNMKIIDNITELTIIDILNEEYNFILNTLIKIKTNLKVNTFEGVNLYQNTILEENKSFINNIDIMIRMAFIVEPESEKFKIFKQKCLETNMIYINKLINYNNASQDKDFLQELLNSDQISKELRETITIFLIHI